jgi:hypothetical protein
MIGESLLSSYIVAGVTISGFSGIVVALGHRAEGAWSHRDRQLLYALLGSSGGSALLSALPLVLASIPLAEPTVWAASSGCSVVLQLGLMALRARGFAGKAETRVRERWLLVTAYTVGAVCLAAQLVNCVWLGLAWPHLATITWHLVLSFVIFVRLVQPDRQH